MGGTFHTHETSISCKSVVYAKPNKNERERERIPSRTMNNLAKASVQIGGVFNFHTFSDAWWPQVTEIFFWFPYWTTARLLTHLICVREKMLLYGFPGFSSPFLSCITVTTHVFGHSLCNLDRECPKTSENASDSKTDWGPIRCVIWHSLTYCNL